MKLLLNGINATDNDLKSIPAEKIPEVEYYTFPPARYAEEGTNAIDKRQALHNRRADIHEELEA